jgi:hypothetical protein
VTATSATVNPAHRLTVDEATRPIEGAVCAKCGRPDATIYPYEERGILVCRSCSPLWLIRYMRLWAEKRWPVAA